MVVDDNPYFLNAARCLLAHQDIAVVGVARNSDQALRLAEQLRPDVALVDIDLGVESGLELAGRMQRETGPTPLSVILISSHAEEEYADLIEASPAVGFLCKTLLSGDAVRTLLAGVDDGHRDDPVNGPPGR
ncbi:response regulator transcription factor [Streptomyces sp. NPDC005728]|uniref:response regulator transcription factor n=1 Tax=Streptomyces sp. NPDC005728 TaxID=3157054 RepID=UPI0033D1F150